MSVCHKTMHLYFLKICAAGTSGISGLNTFTHVYICITISSFIHECVSMNSRIKPHIQHVDSEMKERASHCASRHKLVDTSLNARNSTLI